MVSASSFRTIGGPSGQEIPVWPRGSTSRRGEFLRMFASSEDGIPVLEENTVWGFVPVGQNPEYAGIYITGAVGAIMYVARVNEIVPASEATLSRPLESSTGDQAPFDQNKRVGVFEPESLSALSDPILLATRVPYGLRYTDLEAFRTAETTDEIL